MTDPAGAAPEGRERGNLIRRLLAGAQIDHTGLDYDLRSHHLGLIVTGEDAEPLLRRLAEALGADLLLDGREDTIAGWIGSGQPFEEAELAWIAAAPRRRTGLLAIGEPGSGVAGWRATHRQARTAHALAARFPTPFARYGEVALLATVVTDPDLADFLKERFLAPLCGPSHRDRELLETLRAHLDAGGDISATAAELALGREAVVDRIAVIEELLGRALEDCLAELDLALRLRLLGSDAEGLFR
jgi:hypothetical protein